LRVVNVSCKDSMIALNGSCSCSLGEELDGDDCSSCDGSSFKDWVGDGPCSSCPSFSSSNSNGTSCECEEGGIFIDPDCYCLPGYELSTSGCVECEIGYFKNSTSNLKECDSCNWIISDSTTSSTRSINESLCGCEFDSKYLSEDGSSCLSCPSSSTFNSSSGLCDCNEGSSFNITTGSCVCDLGYEPNIAGECVKCGIDYFKSENGNILCSFCGILMTDSITSSTGSTNSSYCHCDDDEYESEDGSECLSCPAGSTCEEGTTIENMEVDGGYWRVDGESDTILQCPVPAACVGSSSSSYGDNLCRDGHEGPYCSVCEDGYFKEYDGLCEVCSAKSLQRSYILLGVVGGLCLIILYGLVKYTCYVAGTKQEEGKVVLSILDDFNSRTLKFMEHSVDRIHSLGRSEHVKEDEEDEDDEATATKKMIRSQMIMVKIKIAFVFFQVILLFQDVYLIQYPPPYIDFLAFVAFVELDIFRVAKMECAVSGGFLGKLIFSTCIPLGVSLFLFLGWIFSFFKFGRETRQFKIIENTLVNLFIIMTYLLYPSLCATIFSAVVCEDFDDGNSYLRADYSVNCDSSEYSSIYTVALVMILVYPIGIPIMYFSLLFVEKDKLDPQKFFTEMSLLEAVFHRKREVNRLKFLYDAFLPEYYWTEVMECLRKLLLTGFVVFFYEGSALQVAMGLTISVMFAIAYAFLQPYLMPSNNTFAAFVHFQISFTLMCSLLIRVNDYVNSADEKESFKLEETPLSYALLISNASVLIVGLVLVGKAFFSSSDRDYANMGFSQNSSEGEGDHDRKMMQADQEILKLDRMKGDDRFMAIMRLQSRGSTQINQSIRMSQMRESFGGSGVGSMEMKDVGGIGGIGGGGRKSRPLPFKGRPPVIPEMEMKSNPTLFSPQSSPSPQLSSQYSPQPLPQSSSQPSPQPSSQYSPQPSPQPSSHHSRFSLFSPINPSNGLSPKPPLPTRPPPTSPLYDSPSPISFSPKPPMTPLSFRVFK